LSSRKQRLRHPAARLADLRLRLDEHTQRLDFASGQRLNSEAQTFLRLRDQIICSISAQAAGFRSHEVSWTSVGEILDYSPARVCRENVRPWNAAWHSWMA
jgi:hypothetical protein